MIKLQATKCSSPRCICVPTLKTLHTLPFDSVCLSICVWRCAFCISPWIERFPAQGQICLHKLSTLYWCTTVLDFTYLIVFICFLFKSDDFMTVLFCCVCESLCNMDFKSSLSIIIIIIIIIMLAILQTWFRDLEHEFQVSVLALQVPISVCKQL